MTIDMLKKVISGQSEVVVEMVRAAGDTGDTGANMIRNLAIAIIRDGKVCADWERSFISSAFTYALDRGHLRGLKLMEQAIKVTERIADSLIRQAGERGGLVINASDSGSKGRGFEPHSGQTVLCP